MRSELDEASPLGGVGVVPGVQQVEDLYLPRDLMLGGHPDTVSGPAAYMPVGPPFHVMHAIP